MNRSREFENITSDNLGWILEYGTTLIEQHESRIPPRFLALLTEGDSMKHRDINPAEEKLVFNI